MSDSAQRTEKPTQRRLEKARKEGNFPASKEFVSALQFLGFVAMMGSFSGAWLIRTARLTRYLIATAFTVNLTPDQLVSLVRNVIAPQMSPLLIAGSVLVLIVVCAQLASTRFGIAFTKLAPDLKRLNFMKRIAGLPGQNFPPFLQALLLLPLVGMVVYYEAIENLDSFLQLPWMGAQVAALRVGSTIEALLWRAASLFVLVGCFDLFWQNHRYMKQLKMSKQEIRDESKESEGNPQIKMRIRRMQRDLLRRRMMQDVATATALIVNPTHYAVAILYSVESNSAPKVVAKGKNFLALRIRKKALEHGVPIVENPPLAQALFNSVDVGQEIPNHLYRAVAEILAYIYKLMNGRLPGSG